MVVPARVWAAIQVRPDFRLLGVDPAPFHLEAFLAPRYGMLLWWRVPIPLASEVAWVTGTYTWS